MPTWKSKPNTDARPDSATSPPFYFCCVCGETESTTTNSDVQSNRRQQLKRGQRGERADTKVGEAIFPLRILLFFLCCLSRPLQKPPYRLGWVSGPSDWATSLESRTTAIPLRGPIRSHTPEASIPIRRKCRCALSFRQQQTQRG
ncbi:hypothetical protein CPSG_09717 [Coccidioides posadasii str. Silveira]|uniref:Uncharacterized protein n=1 Tax=Coccidioides posadasii (strain RMSCC 757 / Silveira) TaxID=443226 RepID=E9DIS4_COCPS|nr:hypothetical protein CPSG_09717 [Coccidioides posadasii str. Silveira]